MQATPPCITTPASTVRTTAPVSTSTTAPLSSSSASSTSTATTTASTPSSLVHHDDPPQQHKPQPNQPHRHDGPPPPCLHRPKKPQSLSISLRALVHRFRPRVPHVRQSFSWDCGLACLLMVLRLRGDSATSLADLRTVCRTDSVWTIDLAYTMRWYNVPCTLYTVTAGVRHEYGTQDFYRRQLEQDTKRVVKLFQCAGRNGVVVCEQSVPLSSIKQWLVAKEDESESESESESENDEENEDIDDDDDHHHHDNDDDEEDDEDKVQVPHPELQQQQQQQQQKNQSRKKRKHKQTQRQQQQVIIVLVDKRFLFNRCWNCNRVDDGHGSLSDVMTDQNTTSSNHHHHHTSSNSSSISSSSISSNNSNNSNNNLQQQHIVHDRSAAPNNTPAADKRVENKKKKKTRKTNKVDDQLPVVGNNTLNGFLGHYIILYAYYRPLDVFIAKDPAAREDTCVISAQVIEQARLAFGTDQDLLVIDRCHGGDYAQQHTYVTNRSASRSS